MIDHPRLLELLDYCPLSGVFTRKISLTNKVKVGDVAGNNNKGYWELSVDGKTYMAHVLAWFYVYGVWPTKDIDHEDMNKSNNAIKNLREASESQNGANTLKRPANLTGFKGVTAYGKGFKAAIMVDRKRIHLGVFSQASDAAMAYDVAALKAFGNFARTNRQLGLLVGIP